MNSVFRFIVFWKVQETKHIYLLNINLLVSGLDKIHISNTVFHAARNLQGEGVDVDVGSNWKNMKQGGGRWGGLMAVRQLWSRKGGRFKKIYQCFRNHSFRCLHCATISFLLLRERLQSAPEMIIFSTRHNWQNFDSFEYGGASLTIDHARDCGVLLFFKFQIWLDSVVLCALFSCVLVCTRKKLLYGFNILFFKEISNYILFQLDLIFW